MRRPNLIRPVKLTTTFSEDVRARLDIYLYSDMEKRVPHGAYSRFLIDRVNEFFNRKPLTCPHCGKEVMNVIT